MAETITDEQILQELEPEAERLLESHLANAKEWFPHEYVPYGRAEDYPEDYEWTPEDYGKDIDNAVRSALVVNLLTEDNLPYYFRTIESMFGKEGAWGEWARRWTAEEGRHSMVIYNYLMATRAIDPVELERGRMVQVSNGQVPQPQSALDGFVYVALQELATRIAHRNTGKHLDDEGYEVMKRVAADENLHHLFYRDLGHAALKLEPSLFIQAVKRQVIEFEMPGTGIPNFDTHAKAIARTGIYGFNEYLRGVLEPVLIKQWDIFNVDGLDAEAYQSLQEIEARMAKIGNVASREVAKREQAQASTH